MGLLQIWDHELAGAMAEHDRREEPQATHRLQISEAAFKALILAIYHQSARELDICSPRRLLTAVLKDKENRLSRLDDQQLHRLCNCDVVTGRLAINIRIDSSVNGLMRSFRDHAERRLGRPVSVAEAVYVCSYVASLD
ncbi:hypothetical protein [Telmatospirillum sp.]|uniref:hypothetical protein n=1 Tax=Telmatospirillum sp. TaxID=2079197 RepID=UPI0028425BA1|nr:hypothetical protein [Telmatospirillum sp.]MDR3438808.1 hypothetical protein [Telmatospirillum sp.]